MLFEYEGDVVAWYEREERALSPSFLSTIPWHDISRFEINRRFFPVLVYMRDVEKFTSIYYNELLRTPTGKDPVIRRFMDRWSTEESLHGDLLNRFLEEAGCPTHPRWEEEARSKIPTGYHLSSRLLTAITNTLGRHFSAVHMTWGAINEYSTLVGYERLWKLAQHPVLEMILRAIAREEAKHSFVYWSIARLKLLHSRFRQGLTRFIIDHFWSPVGEGTKPTADANLVIATLFKGPEGIRLMDQRVNQRIEQLPGLSGLKRITERVASAISSK